MHILWLGEAASLEVALVGGKVANLSRLAATHRVPPGFCLTTTALDEWLNRDMEHDPVEWMLPTLYDNLSHAYGDLAVRCGGDAPVVAVRSSAADEDGAIASFAGQHDTYLNITGQRQVVEAVVKCWASARSPRAIEYRRRHGLSLEDTRIAVLVQQMVPAGVSAVVFSANPITGNRDELVVNASWGLGESIVSGTVTPDTYILRKSDLKVLMEEIADKEMMTVAVPGGTTEVPVPEGARTQPALTPAELDEVARLALSLEAEMGWPVDIECAFCEGQLYLLQCRPITTLR
jgi:pyruvate,water dikinase